MLINLKIAIDEFEKVLENNRGFGTMDGETHAIFKQLLVRDFAGILLASYMVMTRITGD